MKILLAQLNPTIGAIRENSAKIIEAIAHGRERGADLVLFSEMAITGYPPEDLLLLPHFLDAVEEALAAIAAATRGISAIVGLPRRNPDQKEKPLYNSAALLQEGRLIGYQDKRLLPTYDVFDERRYFEPAASNTLWEIGGKRVAITLCEDIWQHSSLVEATRYREDPVLLLKKERPDLLLNLSASPYRLGKGEERFQVCRSAAATLRCPVLLCNQVGGNDSLIFDGASCYVGSDGQLKAAAASFREELLLIDLETPAKTIAPKREAMEELHDALVLGLRDYCRKTGFTKACLGLSGGVDSALVAYLAVQALGSGNLLAVAMPSRYTSMESVEDAEALAATLSIKLQELPIEGPFSAFLELLAPPFAGRPADATEENLQARIRGMLLMAFSNKFGYLVLSTGNKSEMAMGYSTLYGDMCGGLGVISDLTKEQVYSLCRWINRKKPLIPDRILSKAPSAELRPNQKDSDSLPDYSIVDTVLQAYIVDHEPPHLIAAKHNTPLPLVEELVKRIHQNEYKRRQGPPGLRISGRSFSVGRRFPIAQGWIDS